MNLFLRTGKRDRDLGTHYSYRLPPGPSGGQLRHLPGRQPHLLPRPLVCLLPGAVPGALPGALPGTLHRPLPRPLVRLLPGALPGTLHRPLPRPLQRLHPRPPPRHLP